MAVTKKHVYLNSVHWGRACDECFCELVCVWVLNLLRKKKNIKYDMALHSNFHPSIATCLVSHFKVPFLYSQLRMIKDWILPWVYSEIQWHAYSSLHDPLITSSSSGFVRHLCSFLGEVLRIDITLNPGSFSRVIG